VEYHKAELGESVSLATSPDDAARFLRELRRLRDDAGLEQAELAARAHYPYDLIAAAEAGPMLPDLPVLSAYVRGCGGTPEEWEERWRALTKSPTQSLLPTREAGNSPAADAGARVGSTTPVTDADPSVIIAALSRVAEEMAGSKAATLPAGPGAPATSPAAPAMPARAMPGWAGPAREPDAGRKRSGWDPIRVSSAWPVLRDAPPSQAATSAVEHASASGAWGAVPGADGGGPQPPAAVPATAVPDAAPTAVPTAVASGQDGTVRRSRIRTLVVAFVLICVIAAVLAIFA
jgi:hypothetical protein